MPEAPATKGRARNLLALAENQPSAESCSWSSVVGFMCMQLATHVIMMTDLRRGMHFHSMSYLGVKAPSTAEAGMA